GGCAARPLVRGDAPAFRCPGCGRDGPFRAGEVLANDTIVACRHRWICRYSWTAPGAVAAVTCPRCGTVQPGPDARRISAQLAQWLGGEFLGRAPVCPRPLSGLQAGG